MAKSIVCLAFTICLATLSAEAVATLGLGANPIGIGPPVDVEFWPVRSFALHA